MGLNTSNTVIYAANPTFPIAFLCLFLLNESICSFAGVSGKFDQKGRFANAKNRGTAGKVQTVPGDLTLQMHK